MKFRVVDFDIITRNFKHYVDGFNAIEEEKKSLLASIEPQRKEIESIIKSSASGLIIDEMTQKINMERFKILQEELMQKDNEFKTKLKQMRDDLNTSSYDQLSEFISSWAKENGVDMVMGKMEVVFSTDEVDATEHILNILKEKDLFFQAETVEEI